jgi:hypothetical protein
MIKRLLIVLALICLVIIPIIPDKMGNIILPVLFGVPVALTLGGLLLFLAIIMLITVMVISLMNLISC